MSLTSMFSERLQGCVQVGVYAYAVRAHSLFVIAPVLYVYKTLLERSDKGRVETSPRVPGVYT